MGAHRFLKNEAVTAERLMKAHYGYLSERTADRDLIAIQDTTEYSYQHHKGLIGPDELGKVRKGTELGLRVHPMLVLDAGDNFAYGLSSLQVLNRQGQTLNRHERKYPALPIEEKESNRWLKSINESKTRLGKASSITFVSDRESDIYQLWCRVPDERTHLVVRCCFLRKFTDMGFQSEITPGSQLTRLGETTITLPARTGKRKEIREAQLEVSVAQAWTLKPGKLKRQKANNDPERISVTMVAVKEMVPQGSSITDPVTWFLLSDLPVTGLEDALAIISIYKKRWDIEQLFRLSKQKGFNLEESQLERAHSLENLIALVFIAAIRIFQMVCNRDNQNRAGRDVFEDEELKLLDQIGPSLEGKTERSKNKNKPQTLAFYIWIIARLGNWKPEDRDPPGPITFRRGWLQLETYIGIAALRPKPT